MSESPLKVELTTDPLEDGGLVVAVSRRVVEDGVERLLDLHMRLREGANLDQLTEALTRMGATRKGDGSVLISETEP